MMFLAEGITKNTIGMPKIKRENGRIISEPVESLYSIHKERIPFISKQVDALVDYCETKKMFNKISLKGVPAVMKGLMFVSASILGYKLGNKVADCFLGKKEDSKCN